MARILLVEDNELNSRMLSRRLGHRGCDVLCALTGGEALEMARKQFPDLILMDLNLPDISGLEVTKLLKSEPATKAIPIIALSAHITDRHRQEAISAGCDDYETKPVELERLVKKMQKYLRLASVRAGTWKAVG